MEASMWAGIASFVGKIFGSSSTVDSVVDKVASGLDKLSYTEQEKEQDAMKERAAARAMVVQWMEHTSGQNLARRMLAFIIAVPWMGNFILAKFAAVISVFYQGKDVTVIIDGASKTMPAFWALHDIMMSGMDTLSPPVMLILSFYFAAPHMGQFATAIIEKWTKKV